ncbi:hypothetical protein V501_07651 [Pseudogymnoascus sp. VKM F-4519 (FW-2642)]|nr:hypothetical protein V501_07651 [Pseudogymnoascus sp. VKM F-4519 (FW-2642)]
MSQFWLKDSYLGDTGGIEGIEVISEFLDRKGAFGEFGGVAIKAAASVLIDWLGGEISETRRHDYPQKQPASAL